MTLREAVGSVVPMVIQHGGHCGHAPYCLSLGAMDDRDPMGCCRCGERFRETFTPEVVAALVAVSEAIRDDGEVRSLAGWWDRAMDALAALDRVTADARSEQQAKEER